ncbi:MAG: hypothetical protein COT73_09875 [Bdellovibrio sp. CG10_big_fil_rev_8_21_14_0_10_47_8]|nr:MAG: hypothetical protein COT73_09875 [Bdellovibrio sp. CG10_big_fil_rev_8_21_14_0_10_47_8]
MSHQEFFKGILLSALLATSVVSCSQSSGGGSNQKLSEPARNLDTKSCVYDYTEGDNADYSRLDQVQVVSAAFDKEFNQSLLDGVLTASISSSIPYIEQTGVLLYKAPPAPTTSCSRSIFSVLKERSGGLLGRTEDIFEVKDDSIVLGLYLPQGQQGVEQTSKAAAIILRENTNRWSLIHEFMHHLFAIRAQANGYDDGANKELISQFGEKLKQFPGSLREMSDVQLTSYIDIFSAFVEALDTRLIHYTLEEMAIESHLKVEYNNDRLKYVPSNSNWYIESSGQNAKETYNAIIEWAGDISSELRSRKNLTGSATAVTAAQRKAVERIQEINRLRYRFPYDPGDRAMEINGLAVSQQPDALPCSHTKEEQDLDREVSVTLSNELAR